ncbi:hypothetical protein BOW39_12480 [Solemya velum gill symbiont]|uniref:hypothetical protein n=2 Tax=Solemya velum gill symbiont TaxID=2340 RepID=UPI000997BB29|nr:hypothetical protein [Solemya velum gill symbiont]OOZ48070.1 hypothetical protein BOW39_12480 [Solemya velum gill symbiont]OOZ70498.1 hypothetical protein BOW48_11270 [Solemya velum gill symbiont]OOZ72343.1 hypothetical protein BOW49_11270 [Solemya velum gill symbiont]
MKKSTMVLLVSLGTVALPVTATAMDSSMSFFVTSVGGGDGANFGGLDGADAHCQKLASTAGAGNKTWRAYLSTSGKIDFKNPENSVAAVHARDRIGNGPWHNAKGVLIASDVEQLHSNNTMNKETALSEKGNLVKGRGDKPNEHDILTGSRSDGTAFAPFTDTTCKDWTSNDKGSAVVGHHDVTGLNSDSWSKSWNFSHQSRGCSLKNLQATGGAGLIYCFAAD